MPVNESVVLAAMGLLILGVSVLLGWPCLDSWIEEDRPGAADLAHMHRSARFLLAAIALAAIAAFVSAFPADAVTSVAPVALRLMAGPFLLLGIVSLPRSSVSGSHRTRILVDGVMIISGAAAFAWYFLLGPALLTHWRYLDREVTAIGYPLLDLVLIACLLATSAKVRRLIPRMWAPLAAGTALLIVADCFRDVSLQTHFWSLATFAGPCRLLAMALLAATVIQLAQADGRIDTKESARPETSAEPLPDGELPKRIWNSVLPYALVPSTAALAVYAWQRHLGAEITGGIVLGTAVLVGLTFARQLLAAKENQRLYEQAMGAYQQSLAYAESMKELYAQLSVAKEQLLENNGKLETANQMLQDQATRDPLTGLPNHRAMVQALEHELDRSTRYGRPCSLLFADLDHFKALNDTCGHLSGDAVLREIVWPIQRALRAQDIAGRWGGEEFVILLPETELDEALTVAERIRTLVAEYTFSAIGGTHLTCSIGVASYPYDAGSLDSLVEAADKAMYAAKHMGKNQVRSAADPSTGAFLTEFRRSASPEDASTWGVVEALTTLVKARDPDEDAESVAVADLAMRVAATLGLKASDIRAVGLAARLHDVGMVSVPLAHESEGAVPFTESTPLRLHPSIGADIVGRIPSLALLAPIIRGHHERWNGTGYPDRLAGEDIPIGSRIIAVCDAYLTRTGKRHGSGGLPAALALREVEAGDGTHFDPAVINALLKTIDSLAGTVARAS